MASHNEIGVIGENLAAAWLVKNGFAILHRNWRHRHHEIDIIAMREGKLHFIEVKCRNYSRYGHPEDSVNKKKFRYLKRAADQYLHMNPGNKWIQYDILAITLSRYKETEYFFIEDVFL